MKEFVISEVKAESAILVGLITPQQNEAKTNEYLDELEFLADTAGAVTVKRFTQKVQGPSQVTYVGKGKLQEIAQYIRDEEEMETFFDFFAPLSDSPALARTLKVAKTEIESRLALISADKKAVYKHLSR